MTDEKNIVIIGCGASGGSASQFARKTNRKINIIIFEKDKYPQYSKCGLPYAISGEIPDFPDLIEFDEEWFEKQKIDLNLNSFVETIDKEKKIVYVKKDGQEIKKDYDKIIICTGATPFIPPIKNIKNDNKFASGVFVLRTIDDAEKIKENISKQKNVVIVGAGFIGLEMAESLYKKNMNVTIVESMQEILPAVFDLDIGSKIREKIEDKITILTNHLAEEIIVNNQKISHIQIKNKKTGSVGKIKADMLIIATGCRQNIQLAKNTGCLIGDTGGIVVNERCETSVKNIYAVGDCTEYKDYITKKPIDVGLGSIAVRQGICAGVNAAGGEYILEDGFLQTCTSKFFGIEVAAVGLNKSFLDDYDFETAKYKGSSLPEYFPGGKEINMKIIVNMKDKKFLSAQAFGDKAAQRINTIATAILSDMNIDRFLKLETAYAPPVAPTLDCETLICDIVKMKIDRKNKE